MPPRFPLFLSLSKDARWSCNRRSIVWPALAGIIALAAIAGLAAAASPDPEGTDSVALAVARSSGDGRGAFVQPIDGLPFEERLTFLVGQAIFERLWVAAPASTRSADGLGPLYNARSCSGCHLRNGRGAGNAASLVTKLSVPARTADGTETEPTYGAQLQSLGIPGQTIEGRLEVDYESIPVAVAKGQIELRRPRYHLTDLGFGPLERGAMLSPRLASPIIGMGLLARISAEDIHASADPDDADGDGISGRPNLVSIEGDHRRMLGRFGWKAAEPTLIRQAALALALDIGISSPLLPDGHGDCTARQMTCRRAPTGNTPQFDNVEAPETVMQALLFYLDNLAPPPRRDADDPNVRNGERLFASTGCAACHRPRFVTGSDQVRPWLSEREIHPYTDLLLHDMGEGLADDRPEGTADGHEWRTAPLWGIGLTEAVNGHAFYLHDGRARSLIEAILWHGGEADEARQRFTNLTPRERDHLLRFLGSL